MRSTLMRAGVVLMSALVVSAPRPAPSARFMFPSLVMLRSASVRAPVVFTHAGAVGGNISSDTIAMLYSSLVPHAPASANRVRRRPFIEVAEFYGVFKNYRVDSSGHVPASEFERANHHSRIYLAAGGEPALWDDPYVAPGGVHAAFYALAEPAARALEQRGLTLRAVRWRN